MGLETQENTGLLSDQGDGFHPTLPLISMGALENMVEVRLGRSLVGELSEVVFPYTDIKYPGRRLACALVLGVSVSSFRNYAKRSGDGRLTLPVSLRAEKFCRDLASRLIALADQFQKHSDRLRTNAAPKARGFLTVRVRDETGIPRNAQGHHRKNGVVPPLRKTDKPQPF